MNVGIVGFGILGNAINDVFKDSAYVIKSDPKLVKDSANLTRVVIECEFIFICVPTPYSFSKNEIDTSIIERVVSELDRLSEKFEKKPVVIIKSTTPPRVIKDFIDSYENIDLVVSPEYLTEKNARYDFIHQKVMILGGETRVVNRVSNLFLNYSICNRECKIGFTTPEEAALMKYMANSMLAVKNIFLNQFKDYYDNYFGLDCNEPYNDFLELFFLDERMGAVYTNKNRYTVPGHDGDIGFGGKCLPKDINSIIAEGKRLGVDLTLLKETERHNNKIRSFLDWIDIDGAFVD